jgi:transcriptional regulator with XRE-family HTH domain
MARPIKTSPIRPKGGEARASRVRPEADVAASTMRKESGRMSSRQEREQEPFPELVHMGKVIFNTRKAKGLTQHQLAAMADMNSTSVFMFESGEHNMTIKNILRLAAALGLTLNDMIIRNTPAVSLRLRETAELVEHSCARIQGQLKMLERLASELNAEAEK